MKWRNVLTFFTVSLFVFAAPLAAENISSTNYTLINPEINSASGSTASANYKALVQGGSGISFGQLSSNLYKVGSGQGYTFMANVPKITCFETDTTSLNSDCVALPAGNGMVGECGENGCYDRAMLQIDEQGNPTDTVYSMQMSFDNWATVYIVDGTSHALKLYANKAISDYKTKAQWEIDPWAHFNIIGLRPGVEYKARVTALQGDFTESSPSPDKTATTALPTVTFDIDIGTDINAESDSPYTVSFGAISPEVASFATNQKVKLDMSTNALSGISVYVKDAYSGLRSNSMSYTLQNTAEDLSNPASGDGFGMQNLETAQSASSLGYVTTGTEYSVVGSEVGTISSSINTQVACSLYPSVGTCGVDQPAWVTGGKSLYVLGVRASLNAPAVKDYEDALTFTVVGGW